LGLSRRRARRGKGGDQDAAGWNRRNASARVEGARRLPPPLVATGTATARRRPQRTHLVKVEDEVELAHVAEELVEQLDEKVDGLKVQELVVVHVNGQREEEAGVPAVDELVRPELNKVGKLGVAGSDNPVDLGFDLQPLLVGVGAVVLAQPRLALTVLQQDELEHACAAPAIAVQRTVQVLCFLHSQHTNTHRPHSNQA
jgi:hypothetical protein